jgi:hypothetical protein
VTSLRVPGSACIGPAHAEARRRGDTYILSVKGRPVVCHPCASEGYSSARASGDARPIQVHGCARLRRAYQQRLLQVRAPPARMRAGTPAHPGLYAQAPPGLPGAQRGLQPAVSAYGRDARAPGLRRRADRLPAIRFHSGSHKGRTWWTGLNTPGNSAPHAVTEINFGLHSASDGRLARHDG